MRPTPTNRLYQLIGIVKILLLVLGGYTTQADPIDSLENALKSAQGDKKVKTLNELCRAYMPFDPVKAITYTREALSLALEIDDKRGLAASYNNLGVAYSNQGALDKALEYHLISLKINTELGNKEGIASSKGNIGKIYSIKKDYGQAMKYFEESHKMFTELGDQRNIFGTMNNLGNLHNDLQLYEQALKYYSQAWQLSEKMGKPLLDPLSNIGNLYFRQGNYQRAVDYYDRALALSRAANSKTDVLNITANLGEVYSRAGRAKEALDYLTEALALSRELQAHIFQPQILKSIAACYASQGKTKEAYETMLEYDKAKEKIYGEESTRKIAQMEVALELQEKEREMEALKKDDAIKTLQLRNTQVVVTAFVLGLIVLIAGANLFFLKRKNSAR
jgi:tetratricopeptide (TPR) repeat protein